MSQPSATHSGHNSSGSEAKLPTVPTEFAALDERALLELIEAPWNRQELALAVYDSTLTERDAIGQVRYLDLIAEEEFTKQDESSFDRSEPEEADFPFSYVKEYVFRGRRYIPVSADKDPIVKQVRFARGASRYVPEASALVHSIQLLLRRCLDLEEEYPFLLACFIVSTWLIDRLPIAPYLALVGLPQSGKTTALMLLRLLCRRSLLTADVTSAAFYRACDLLNPTVLIDETATMGQKQALFHLLRAGTVRDVITLRQNRSYRTYGAKVITWTELPADEALNSRCIVIPMQETRRAELEKPLNSSVVAEADSLQMSLLAYRLRNYYRKLSLPKISGEERLHSRTRDLYEAVGLSLCGDSKLCTRLLECFERQQDLNREPLSPGPTAVLEALFERIHKHREEGSCLIGELTKDTNRALAQVGEHRRLNPREVGGILTTFGFLNRRRTTKGWMIWLGRSVEERVHFLMTVYGIRGSADLLPSPELADSCEFCRDV